MQNSLTIGYTNNDESRGDIGTLFPFIDIMDGSNVAYTSVGSEPFTPNNELRYNTFQLQDSFTKYTRLHTLTFGASVEKYNSENVFFPGKQSAYVYNTLDDFFTDLNGYLANPNRTTSPVTLAPVPGALQQHPRAGETDPAARRVVHRRLCAGRLAAGART